MRGRIFLQLVAISLASPLKSAVEGQQLVKSRVPEFSLVAPFTADDNQKWETGAGARVETNYVRLTPALPGRTGSIRCLFFSVFVMLV